MHGTIQKGLRYGAALVLAMALCATAALAAGTEGKRLVPVGHTVGVKLFARGVVVVKLPEGGTPARTCGLKTGDVIVECGGEAVTSTEQFQSLLQKNGTDATALEIKRQGNPLTLSVEPERNEQGVCCIGAWIRDSMAGVGTLTYYDPATGSYGALGHGITDVDTAELMPLASGSIMETMVKAVKKGQRGDPGELKGDFTVQRDVGTVTVNSNEGIFGTVEDAGFISGEAVSVAEPEEVHAGEASILCTISGSDTRAYEVEILRVNPRSRDGRDLLLRVTDPELLETTGGIVQGMSGSPILQDGRLVGAVTHVLVANPAEGYGIFLENMLTTAG